MSQYLNVTLLMYWFERQIGTMPVGIVSVCRLEFSRFNQNKLCFDKTVQLYYMQISQS